MLKKRWQKGIRCYFAAMAAVPRTASIWRRSLWDVPAIALTVDTSILTAVANDYGYDTVFARQVQALGEPGDVLVGISTSGNSKNVLLAIEEAKAKGITCIGMTAEGGGKMAAACDICLAVPARVTARAQEMHILMGHILCELVDHE